MNEMKISGLSRALEDNAARYGYWIRHNTSKVQGQYYYIYKRSKPYSF